MANLDRFIEAQRDTYETALAEIRAGRKKTHWMWFIFPQLRRLGRSHIAQFYGIENLAEATGYLQHTVLGQRLLEISRALAALPESSAHTIFGSPDDLKLRSCMTLFSQVRNADSIFKSVLDKYFSGEPDRKTLEILALD